MPEPVGSTVATKVFTELLTAFGKKIATSVGNRLYSAATSKGSSLKAHIEVTFDRCTKIKTLLNRDEPVPLLSLYVNLKFRSGTEELDDYDVIEQLETTKRIIISGSGGGGKTMFMKYLWIALFENPRGRIPVFVELRRLNEVTTDKLDVYIYRTIIESQSILSEEEFRHA